METQTQPEAQIQLSDLEEDIRLLESSLEEPTVSDSAVPTAPAKAITHGNRFVQMKTYLFDRYEFRLNSWSLDLEYKSNGDEFFLPLNNNDLEVELLEQGFKGIRDNLQSLLRSSRIPRYNPLEAYLENCPKWSPNQPDFIEQLAGFVVAKDQPWFNLQFKKMLVRSLACGLNRIPFNKQCFTLASPQNDGKSSFLRFLCPKPLEAFLKEDIEFDSKDGRWALCTNLFINLDELASLSKSDINRVKAFLTTNFIKERLPYDRSNTRQPRIANFLASTNKVDFLTDETGNVRWLIFEIDSVRHDNGGQSGYEKQIDLDKVYGQAFYLLESGFQFQLTSEELKRSERVNKSFLSKGAEAEFIEKLFSAATEAEHEAFLTATEIAQEIVGTTTLAIAPSRVGKALTMLGFPVIRKHSSKSGNTVNGYYINRNT